MGQRFLEERYFEEYPYSEKGNFLRRNEERYKYHRTKPYGIASSKYKNKSYRETNGSRQENKSAQRSPKKTERQRAKKMLREEEEYVY